MSNLLLITDVARLRKIFGRLTEDKNIRLRVVNNLEKGGEEIAIEKPDVVFVQTHLSGLSADILLMHLKKQLGRKRSRFVLLAAAGQVNSTAIKSYQGWLDTSAEDSQLLSELNQLLATLLNKTKKRVEPAPQQPAVAAEAKAVPENSVDSSAVSGHVVAPDESTLQPVVNEQRFPALPEPSLEEQGITYAPRQRLKIYSEFNSSFDTAVSSTPEPEFLEKEPLLSHNWSLESADAAETGVNRSKKGTFFLWLAPVIVAVVVITYFQHQRLATKPEKTAATAVPDNVVKPAAVATPDRLVNMSTATKAAPSAEPGRQGGVLTVMSEKHEQKPPAAKAPTGARLTKLPEFIPTDKPDKNYGITNPGWEFYMGNVTEFRVLKEARSIKAIQVIDRGWRGVSERFMKRALRQVTSNPSFSIYTSEIKDGYEIQRGRVADNISVVYYRDEQRGTLQAFVLTWQ